MSRKAIGDLNWYVGVHHQKVLSRVAIGGFIEIYVFEIFAAAERSRDPMESRRKRKILFEELSKCLLRRRKP